MLVAQPVRGVTVTYDVFLAHAGADIERARELYRLLVPDLRVFLDQETLLPGDEWDLEMPKAQQASLMTAILVSSSAEAAYYLREEIATAIKIHRVRPNEHRAVPIYLDGMPGNPHEIPYGLRILHGIDARAEGGLPAVAQRLKVTVAKLQGQPPPSVPVPAGGGSPDWIAFYDHLCHLLDSQFSGFIFRAGLPAHEIPGPTASQATRAISVVQLLQQAGTGGWQTARTVLHQVAPGLTLG